MYQLCLFLTLIFASLIPSTIETEAAANCTDKAVDCWCKVTLCRNNAYRTLMDKQCCETCTRYNSSASSGTGARARGKRLTGFAVLNL